MSHLPLHTLDPALFTRALPLLDDEWLAKDADLAPVLPTVLARGVGQDWHKAVTFSHHLVGVARSLTVWRQPRDVRRWACCTVCTAGLPRFPPLCFCANRLRGGGKGSLRSPA